MGDLMKYSAIATKIRAMESRLLKKEDYRRLAEMASVPQAVAYLKKIPAYSALFGSRDENQLHRGEIEKLLIGTLYFDFQKFTGSVTKPEECPETLLLQIRNCCSETGLPARV